MTMQSVVREINAEYDTRLDEIQSSTTYDVLEMSGSRAVWKEVLSLMTHIEKAAQTGLVFMS